MCCRRNFKDRIVKRKVKMGTSQALNTAQHLKQFKLAIHLKQPTTEMEVAIVF